MGEGLILGAIAGDIIGSIYEFNSTKNYDFLLFSDSSTYTDDTVMTVANADWLVTSDPLKGIMLDFGNRYTTSYGGRFFGWLLSENPQPYNSWGNGSAMRVSPIGWAFDTLEETLVAAKQSAEVTHNHPEGIKGAQAIASCVLLARQGKTKSEIKKFVEETFEYDLSRKLKDFQKEYRFDVSCMGSVPEAIICFLESETYEDAIRNCIWLGGDCDTTGAMCGAIAEAFYGHLNEEMVQNVMDKLDDSMKKIVIKFSKIIENKQ